ncbi:hypothetical protein Tco_1378805 [Tanacetum coccineum]
MFKCVRPLAGKTFQEEFRSAGWCKENSDGQKTVAEDMGFNLLVHSFRALSTLKRSGLRTASAAAKPVEENPDGSSRWKETCQFTTPCSHFIFLIKDIMIAESPTTQLPERAAKLSSKWRFRKISMNFEARRSSFSRNFSLLALEGYGKIEIITALAIDLVQTVPIANFGIKIDPADFGCFDGLHRRKNRDVAIGGWTILVRMTTPAGYTTLLDRFYRSGSWSLVFLIENQCSTHNFQPRQQRIKPARRRKLVLTFLKQWACLRDDKNFELALDDF